jgi:hypothetical protein
MKNSSSNTRILLSSLALGLLAGVAPVLYGGDDGLSGGFGRGDNPVIGSLPCIVDPRIDDLFWIPNGLPKPPGGFFAGLPAVGALISGAEFEDALLAVSGDPYGFINGYEHWTVLGFVRSAQVSINRSDLASSRVRMWQFLPKGYLGGEMRFEMPGYTTVSSIGSQNMLVQLTEVAGLPDAVGVARVVFSPNAYNQALCDITILIPFHFGTVSIKYQP